VEQVCSTDANDELVNGGFFFWLVCLISVGIHECFLLGLLCRVGIDLMTIEANCGFRFAGLVSSWQPLRLNSCGVCDLLGSALQSWYRAAKD
jgi:hypothetical protein